MAPIPTLSTYELPLADQSASPLLRLPAELRFKILRLLLKKGCPIDPRNHVIEKEHSSVEDYKASIELSAQVLRVCQQLQLESQGIFYGENILVLGVHLRYPNETRLRRSYDHAIMCCEVLDLSIPIPRCAEELHTLEIDLLDQVYEENPKQRREWPDPIPAIRQVHEKLVQIYPSLLRFQNVMVFTSLSHDWEHVVAFCMLRKLLLDKYITICTKRTSRYWDLDGIGSCRMLRCKTCLWTTYEDGSVAYTEEEGEDYTDLTWVQEWEEDPAWQADFDEKDERSLGWVH